MKTEYLQVDMNSKDTYRSVLERGASIIKGGGLLAFPTETVYGLGASAFNREAVLQIYKVKNRPLAQPFLLHISSIEQLAGIVELSSDARALADEVWPGPVSFIVPGGRGVVRELLGPEGRIGLRFPSHPVARDLIKLTGPLAATSANMHGETSPGDYMIVQRELDGMIDGVLAVETGISGQASTIIDMCVKPYTIVRSGDIDLVRLKSFLPDLSIDREGL